ncbi:MAG: winged helix-turn-helix transcriptional regulator [Clostridia bacterium]|nr:winged helix-turn-helix transcriptional regulator [Clostridia bacterium]MBQ8398582.1 winged helix-turn-helix transcriptional regulator [Clostridia bacterium]
MDKILRDLWTQQTAIQELYRDCIEPVCKKHQINPIEFGILIHLHKYPTLNRGADIVKMKGLSKSYVSLSVKTLTKKELLVGEYRDGDRKNIYLRLLPLAEPIIADGLEAQKQFCQTLYKGFSEEEISQLFSYYTRVNENVVGPRASKKQRAKS